MTDWKTAGRAPREVEDDLWNRFKAAQDVFFQARSATFAEQDVELRGNQAVKEEILAEAEALDPSQGRDKASKRLRELQERWEAAGKVPRDVMRSLEDRMGKVEEKFRAVSDQRFVQASESPFVVRLREKVAELEAKLDKARAAGRPTEELEASLATQRQWLSQAGGASAPVAGGRRPAGRQEAEEHDRLGPLRQLSGHDEGPDRSAVRALGASGLGELRAQEVDRAAPGGGGVALGVGAERVRCRCGRRARRRRSGTPPPRPTRGGSAPPGRARRRPGRSRRARRSGPAPRR